MTRYEKARARLSIRNRAILPSCFAAIAIGAGTAHPAHAQTCQQYVGANACSAAFFGRLRENRAKRRAIRRWERKVRSRYGCLFQRFEVARDVRWDCRVNGCCTLVARPCSVPGYLCS